MSTPHLGLLLPQRKAPNWDNALNSNFVQLDQFLSGVLPLPGLAVSSSVRGPVQSIYGQRLCIYYGAPQGVNGLWVTEAAAQTFAAYDYVVFGDLVEDPAGANYATSIAVIARMKQLNPAIRIFGYIDLGVAPSPPAQNNSMATIQQRVGQWSVAGATDIFFDDAGYDFQVSRARQNAAVDAAHTAQMGAVLNAWVVADALGSAVDATYNPSGIPPHMDTRDCYLLESWIAASVDYAGNGGWEDVYAIKVRADAAVGFRAALGVKILASATADWSVVTSATALRYFQALEAMAAIYSLDGYGLDTYQFGASAPNANVIHHQPYSPYYGQCFLPAAQYEIDGGWTTFSRLDIGLNVLLTPLPPVISWASLPATYRPLTSADLPASAMRVIAATDTATSADHTLILNGAFTETLPALPNPGQVLYLANVGSSSVTVAGNGISIWSAGATASSITLASHATAILQFDAASTTHIWRQIK